MSIGFLARKDESIAGPMHIQDQTHTPLSYPRDEGCYKSYFNVKANTIKFNYLVGKSAEFVNHRTVKSY